MDASGNGHHGSVVGATLTSDRNNNADRAYYFNGKDNYIFVSPGDAFAPNQFTICAMVSIEEQVTTNCCPRIIHRMRWVNCKDPGSLCTGYDMHYQEIGDNYKKFLTYNFFDKTGGELSVVSPQNLEYGKWYQVAVTYDEKVFKFYFNGILNHAKTVTSPIAHTPDMNFLIGSDGGVGTFKGKIDEVYFYNRVLTDDEILQFKNY
ncbi:MAG: LamG domain-containing protein [Nitrospinae bacterium]|nr:LamG domain-containing protein [Nitrospinota bacterium]